MHLKHLMWSTILRDLRRHFNTPLNVLEPECGMGDGRRIVVQHLTSNINYSGFDYSDKMVQMLKENEPDLNVWQADATKFEPERNAYDIVILIGGLHHIPSFAAHVVGALGRSLKGGGLFINYEPTYGNSLSRWVRENIYKSNSLFDPTTERSFAVDELFKMFGDAGLKPLKVRYPGLLSYVLYYNPDAFPALNVGGRWLVDATFALDRLLYANAVGRFLSFATLSIWERPVGDV